MKKNIIIAALTIFSIMCLIFANAQRNLAIEERIRAVDAMNLASMYHAQIADCEDMAHSYKIAADSARLIAKQLKEKCK